MALDLQPLDLQPENNKLDIRPLDLQPVSTAPSAPKPLVDPGNPAPLTVIPPTDFPGKVSLDLAPVTAQAPRAGGPAISSPSGITVTPIYTPTENDMMEVLSKVSPAERDIARQVLQRDVKTREDMNILQGHLEEYGKKHGFGLTAKLVEDALNPMTLGEIKFFDAALGLAAPMFRRMVRGKDISPEIMNAPATALDMEPTVTPFELMTRREIEQKKAALLPQLSLPDDISRVTPSDPMGILPKRLALPGEADAEVVRAERQTANDPLGVLQGKAYRIVPSSRPIPDELLKDVTPDGLRDIVLHQNALAQDLVEKTIKQPARVPGTTRSEKAAKSVVDMVRGETKDASDLILAAEAKRSIQVETEIFKDPERVMENMNQTPLNQFQLGLKRFSSVLDSGRDVARNMGPVGGQIADREREAITVAQVRTGAVSKVLNQVLPQIEKEPMMADNLVDFLEGKSAPINDYVRKAGIAIRGMMDQVGNEAREIGLKIYRTKEGITADWVPRKDYWPRFYDIESLAGHNGGGLREKIIQQVMDAKELPREKAIRLIDDFVQDSVQKFGPLEKGRTTDLPGYSRDVRGVLNTYFEGAFRRLELARQLGPNNEIAGQLINAVPDAYQRKSLDAAIQMMTGRTAEGSVGNLVQENQNAWLKFLSKAFMPLSALSNSAQGVYGSYVKTNMVSTIKAFAKAFTESGQVEAKEAGAVIGKFSDLFAEHIGKGNFFERSGFAATEEFNRTVQGLAQKYYMEGKMAHLLKTDPSSGLLYRELETLGLNADKIIQRGSFTADEINKGMVNAVALTQGRFDNAAVPIFASTGLGKIIYHLKAFDLLWWKFAKDYTIKEAANGNFMPAIKLFTGGVAVGELQSSLWRAISGRDKPEEPIQRVFNDLGFASSLGIMTDIVGAMTTGKKQDIANFFSNPSEQTGQDVLNMMVDLRSGKFSSSAKLVGKRALVPAAVNFTGRVNPALGLAAGVGTRFVVDRVSGALKEQEAE